MWYPKDQDGVIFFYDIKLFYKADNSSLALAFWPHKRADFIKFLDQVRPVLLSGKMYCVIYFIIVCNFCNIVTFIS